MFKHFLVPLDGSSLAECVLPHAIALARIFAARVTLLGVVAGPHPDTLIEIFGRQMHKVKIIAYLDSIAAALRAEGVPTEVVVMVGDPVVGIIDYLYNQPVDLIILSSHGESGLTAKGLGSVVQKVFMRTRISSLLVRAAQPVQTEQSGRRYQRILMPLDEEQSATSLLPFITSFARIFRSQLLFAYVLCTPQMLRTTPHCLQDATLAGRRIASNYEVVTNYLTQLEPQLPNAPEHWSLESEDIATCLHELAAAEQVDLLIFDAHQYSVQSQRPSDSIITKLIVQGRAPLLLVQGHLAEWMPTIAGDTAQLCEG